jgi:hypothetical protein
VPRPGRNPYELDGIYAREAEAMCDHVWIFEARTLSTASPATMRDVRCQVRDGDRTWESAVSSDGVAVEVSRIRARALADRRPGVVPRKKREGQAGRIGELEILPIQNGDAREMGRPDNKDNLDAAGVTTTTPIQLNDDGQASHWA